MPYEQGLRYERDGTFSVECTLCRTEHTNLTIVATGFGTREEARHFITEHRRTVHKSGEIVKAVLSAP